MYIVWWLFPFFFMPCAFFHYTYKAYTSTDGDMSGQKKDVPIWNVFPFCVWILLNFASFHSRWMILYANKMGRQGKGILSKVKTIIKSKASTISGEWHRHSNFKAKRYIFATTHSHSPPHTARQKHLLSMSVWWKWTFKNNFGLSFILIQEKWSV